MSRIAGYFRRFFKKKTAYRHPPITVDLNHVDFNEFNWADPRTLRAIYSLEDASTVGRLMASLLQGHLQARAGEKGVVALFANDTDYIAAGFRAQLKEFEKDELTDYVLFTDYLSYIVGFLDYEIQADSVLRAGHDS